MLVTTMLVLYIARTRAHTRTCAHTHTHAHTQERRSNNGLQKDGTIGKQGDKSRGGETQTQPLGLDISEVRYGFLRCAFASFHTVNNL